MLRRRGWLLLAAALVAHIASTTAQGFFFPDEEPPRPSIRPRSGVRPPQSNRPSKVHRGNSKVNRPSSSSSRYRGGCEEMPPSPMSAVIRCSTYSGCRATCMAGHQFPNGEGMIAIRCVDGEWTPQPPYEDIPDCAPVCKPVCQNGGTCIGPDVCQCPEGFSGSHCEERLEQCNEPRPTIYNARLSCSNTRCSVVCMKGHETADHRTTFEIKCTEELGWTAVDDAEGPLPACQPICRPKCENGGKCISFNMCQCPQQYRGPSCQWSVENCNPKTQLNFNGAYNCSGRGDQFGCQLSCPEGMEFSSPPAAIYQCDYSTGEYRPQPIPRCQGEYEVIAPTEATFVTAVVAPEPRQCALWSGKHVKTFDGQVYSFTGGCEFTAVRDSVTSLFKVSVVRGCDRPDCDWHLRLTVDRTVLLLAADEDGTVTVTQEQSLYSAQPATLAVPSEVDGLVLEKEGNKRIIVRATNIGVTIRYSREMILIQAESSLWNTVQGLCGTLDGNVYNDLLSDGLRGTLQYFSTRELCPAGDVTTELSCTGAALKQAKTVCTNALQRADVFSPCQETMGVEYFLRACTAEYCHSISRSGAGGYPAENRAVATAAICETVTAFATECERVTSRSLSWRSEEFCPLPCPAGQVFSPCGVPAAGRCGAAVTDSWICEEGCTCPEGLLMDGDQCVEAERCSCQHNGVRHEAGETVQQDCNTCTCSAGKWLCTELACPSTCVVAGDPHYLTFDGLRYDFQGKCTYYLVQADRYNIQAENVPCSGAISEKLNYHPSTLSAEPSCTKSVRIEHEGITVDLKQDLQVLINGETAPMVPWWVDGLYIKYASSLYISVTLPNGLEVWWDGETRVEVHAPSGLTDSISGLCGNNNGNQRDDFATPEGDIEMSAIEFASKWKVDETCDDKTEPHGHPCEVYSEKYAEASTHCDRLVSMPMFQACHSVVDPAPYVKNCEYDLCSCRTELADCYCVHLADYASACAARGVQIPWRAEIGMCGKGCPFGQQYQVCGDSCGHTCFDLATASQCERHCVEGCQCPEGQALDADDRCAPISSCPCVHNNKEYRPGHRRYQGTGASLQQCECVNARWDCELSKTEKLTDNSGKCDASAHMLYVDCLPEHPVTCKSRHSSRPETTKSLYAACEPGCVCADGYVLDASSGECVTPERCPCHHGGKAYQHGATFATECRSCTCEGGMWTCEEQSCDGVCTAWGNSHYETFDGRIYDIEGDCQYLLAKGKETSKDQFEVIVTNVPCGAGSTCPKAVLIRVGHGTTLEKVALEADQPLPTTFELTRLSVRQAGAFAFVEAPSLGLVVQWDYGTRIYIRLSSQWRGKMQGLCGNFDGNPGDDFRGPSGLLENTAVQFAEQYKLQPYCPTTQPIVDSCKLHPERRLFAVRRCAALKSPVFADCHSELDVAPFFERCVQDTCACTGGGDCECLCTAVAAYGQACSRRGVHVRWRSNDLCPMQCDTECSQYSPCVSACPPKTCENRYIYEDITGMCADDTCVEGCQPKPCPSGQVYHNATLDSCVKENDCKTKCAVIGDKQLYEGDVITRDDCHVCYCTRGQQKCRGSPCPVVITTEKPPPDDDGPSPMQLGVCREGWSAWVNRNKPMAYTRPRDVERIPTFIEPTDRQDARYAVVDLVPGTSDAVSGRITFVQKSADEPLDIVGEVEGLKPGSHGFHIHETGSTANQCSAAGGHFNPARMAHGSPMSAVRHVGDLGNIVADSFGRAQVRITMPAERISLFGKNGVIGLALVVHDAVDDLGLGAPGSGSQLTGNAGARLACGIVKKAYDVSSGVGFCADNQVTSVRCRTAGTHLSPSETGERVRCELHDGLVCDSDFVCQDYELQVLCDCSIEPTEEPPVVTTPAPPTKPPSECEEDGWTDWMSSHTPATGDWTDVEDAKSLREAHSFCEERYISAIECRTKLGHQDVKKIGGGAVCDLNSGLVCSDALGYCPDFEVRFFCNCEKIQPPTPVPTVAGERCYPVGDLSAHLSDCHKFLQCNADGKQIEMSCTSTLMFDPVTEVCDWPATVVAKRPECAEITEPTTTPGPAVHCDDKKPVREHPTDCHAYYQCLRTSNGVLSEILQSCGKHMMYNPKTMTCDSVANVRALRPECAEPPPVVCKANEIYDDCKIRCDQLCHYYDGFLEAQGFCKVKDACKPGCRLSGLGYRGCPGGFVWTDEERCVRISDCNCRLPNGKPLGPGQVQVAEDGCTRVQCINNHLVYDHSSCPSSTTPSTRILENCNLWGEWIDSTNPTVGDYEAEMLPWWETFCDEGYLKEIECQETETGASYELTSDVGVTCNIKNGLACSNKAQPNGRCHNYRIRYYCSCGVDPSITTTTPTPEETTTPTETPTPTYPTVVPPEDCDVERFIPLVYGEEPLPDSAITASSAVLPEAAPAYAKILGQFQDARRSWSPTENNQNQYLQIDLGESQPVYAVKVAGNPALKAAVVKFELWISDDGEEFQPLTNDRGLPQGLTSIGALATAEPVILPTPVTARYVRMLPRTWQTRIAAKLEVYGCSRATEPPPTTTDASVVVTTVEPPPHCDEEQFIPLLYGEDTLPDSSFSASSVVGPAMAAQYAKIKGSADDKARSWTPANNDQNQYLQVDLGSVKPVYAVTVMGNKAISSAVTQFELLYSLDGSIFSYAFNPMGQQLTLTAVEPLGANPGRIILPVPVEGRYIRIHPTDWTTRITLKLELFGCSEVTPTPTPTPTPPPRCLEEMGLENGLLHDSLIEVSSSLSPEHDASALRPGSAGWIPKQSNNKQFIKVDLTDERTIDGIVTTGVLVKGAPVPGYPGQFEPDQTRYIGSYRVRYSQDGVHWIWVYNKSGRVKVFPGHSDRTALSPMQNVFEQPLHARFVEIAPETWPEDGIGATVELLGCYHPYPEVTTTTTPAPPDTECHLCPDVPHNSQEGCEQCGPEQHWNGTGCISGTALCPCFYNGRAYQVGSLFDLSDCQECVCQLGGSSVCERKDCPPCGGDLVSKLSESCDCQCNPCEEGTRICPTSRTCLDEEKWCDGVKQCPDDEGDECIITTPPPPTTTTTPPPLLPQYCTLKGNTFNTFDGVEYKYQICHHTLAEHEGVFYVTVHHVCEGADCHREVRITSLEEKIILVPGTGVIYGGFTYDLNQAKSIRSDLDAFEISVTPAGSILFNAPQVGFAVIVNDIGNVVVGLNNKHANEVEGLCGNFDGNRNNDKHKPDGTLAASTQAFGDSWKLPGEEQSCEVKKCNQTQQAFSICQKIRQEPFSRCHLAVQPDSFISSCLETTCACLDGGKGADECRCEALNSYVTECLSLDPSVDLDHWRTKHQCPSDCPPGEVYRDCYRPTCEPSCKHLEPCDILPDMCFSGCYCPDGQVRGDKGDCVDPVHCDDCKCGVYPGGNFETFDKEEINFNTNCSYQAAGRDEPNGKYNFRVLVDNGNCHTTYSGSVTCTDDVRVEWATNIILLQRSGHLVEVFVNGAMVEGFHRKYDWGTVSQPPKSAILIEVPALHLEVSLHPVSGELSVLLPSKIYGGSVGGVCGNCNGDKTDEAQRPPTFWLLDHERADQCVSEKPVCVPPPPESDPCQKLLNATVFGACHQLEDPAPLVEACQKRLCDDKQHDICDDLESYAERCFESGLCLEWRSTDLCGRDDACPPTTEYRQCAGTCLKSCEKQDCPRVEMDGCYCPEGQVYEEERCVSENRCKFCDDKGHRAGDKWKPNNCTTCECLTSDLSVRCVEVGCPDTSKVECGPYEVVAEIEGTGTECCPPHYTCRPAPSTTTTEPPVHCPEVVRPTCDAAEGKKIELLTVNGCQVAVCECVPEAECPAKLQLRPLNNGEAYRIRPDTCCPLEEIVCNKTTCRPPPACPEGFQLKQLPETAGDCCPTSVCRQPPDTCLVRLDVDIDIRSITAEMDEGFVLKRAGEVWTDGFCDNCTCREVVDGDPLYQPVCVRVACREPSAADRAEFVYEENEEGGDMCCPELVRTACRDNGKVYQPGQTWQPSIGGRPVNPCVSWTCEKDDQHGVIKVSNREKCVEDCRLGHTYVPAPPGSGQCCGECERTACVVGGVEHAEGDIWKSEDGCTEFTCERDFFDGQLTVMSMAALCRDVSDCPPENLYTDETGCCQRCNRTDNCHVKVVPPAETIRMFKQGECVNTEPVVGVINCKGACDSMAFFDTDSSTIQSGCKCCGVTATKQLDLLLTCSTGNTIYHTFTVPDGCACSKCDSSSSKMEGSSSAGAFWQQSTGEDWTQQTAGGGGIPDPWAVGGGGDPWALGGGGGGGDPDPWALGGGGGNPWDDLPFPDDNGKDAGDGGVSDSELLSLLQGAGPGANDIGTGPIH